MTSPTHTAALRHIIWDWNGTLFDDISACVGSINQMLAERRLPILDYERYRGVFGFPVRDFYLRIGFDLDTEDWNRLARDYHDRYLELSRNTPLRPGSRTLLEHVRSRGISMSLLSASEQSILDDMLAHRGIASFFDGVYGLDNLHAVSKLDIGRKLLSDLAVEPASAVLVGDTTHDYDVASALGCGCLLMAGGHQAKHRLEQCGCEVASDLDDVKRMIEDALSPAPGIDTLHATPH